MSPDNCLLCFTKLRIENDSYRHEEKVSISEQPEDRIVIKVTVTQGTRMKLCITLILMPRSSQNKDFCCSSYLLL